MDFLMALALMFAVLFVTGVVMLALNFLILDSHKVVQGLSLAVLVALLYGLCYALVAL